MRARGGLHLDGMELTLLVLAAGLGSRYGGLKQVDPVGPSGETILDYAVYDALRAGFGRVVFVIRRDFEDVFRSQIGAKYGGRIAVDYVFQAAAALPAGYPLPVGREKPWGTGHAVWCAREAVAGPFAVIGADDFFGRDAFVQLAGFISDPPHSSRRIPHFAMAGYRLADTLSEHGAVARGLCTVRADGRLARVDERTGIRREAVGPGGEFTGDETVSMNCWAFTPEIFPVLGRQFADFLQANVGGVPSPRSGESRGGGTPPTGEGQSPRNPLKAEFYLPEAVSQQIATGAAEVRVLPTTATWFGVTYRGDRPRVQAALAALVAQGEYPARLF